MFRTGDLFDLADSAVARATLVLVAILAVLTVGLEASGLLDLSELIACLPILAVSGSILGGVWIGSAVANWLSAEPAAGEHTGPGAHDPVSLDDPDLLPVDLSPGTEPCFRDRVSAGRAVADALRSRDRF